MFVSAALYMWRKTARRVPAYEYAIEVLPSSLRRLGGVCVHACGCQGSLISAAICGITLLFVGIVSGFNLVFVFATVGSAFQLLSGSR